MWSLVGPKRLATFKYITVLNDRGTEKIRKSDWIRCAVRCRNGDPGRRCGGSLAWTGRLWTSRGVPCARPGALARRTLTERRPRTNEAREVPRQFTVPRGTVQPRVDLTAKPRLTFAKDARSVSGDDSPPCPLRQQHELWFFTAGRRILGNRPSVGHRRGQCER